MRKNNMVKVICALSLTLTCFLSSKSFAYQFAPCVSKAQLEIFKKTYTKAPNPLKSDPKKYPLTGRVEYGIITKELLDAYVADGGVFMGTTADGRFYDTRKRASDMAIAYNEYLGQIAPAEKMTNYYLGDHNTKVSIGNSPLDIYMDLAGLYDGELSEKAKQVRVVIADFLNSFDFKNAGDKEKLDRVLKFTNSKYKYGASDEETEKEKTPGAFGSVWGALIDGRAVCSGDAETLQLLCNCVGLNSIAGTTGGHDWAYAEVDGKWYHIATSFTPYMKDGESTDEELFNHKFTLHGWELK